MMASGCVCCAGSLVALSGMTGMQSLDLTNNQLTGALWLCFVYHCISCCRVLLGMRLGVPAWRFVWQL
jgi:hypothetical protein